MILHLWIATIPAGPFFTLCPDSFWRLVIIQLMSIMCSCCFLIEAYRWHSQISALSAIALAWLFTPISFTSLLTVRRERLCPSGSLTNIKDGFHPQQDVTTTPTASMIGLQEALEPSQSIFSHFTANSNCDYNSNFLSSAQFTVTGSHIPRTQPYSAPTWLSFRLVNTTLRVYSR